MIAITPCIPILASGGHNYLYGLLFLIVSLAIGAASKHFLKIFPKIPLPFTVFLLIIGLVMGALNRPFKEKKESQGAHGSHGHAHAEHVENSGSGHPHPHTSPDGSSPPSKTNAHHGDHGPDGADGPDSLNDSVKKFLNDYRDDLRKSDSGNLHLLMGDLELFKDLGRLLDEKDAWDYYEQAYSGIKAAYTETLAHTAGSTPEHEASTDHKVAGDVLSDSVEHSAVHEEGHGHGHEEQGMFAKILHFLQEAIYWGSQMDAHLILYVFLPILIFEAAFAMDMHTFKKSAENAFWMAGPGIVTATLMTGGLMMVCLQFDSLGLEAWKNFDLSKVLDPVEGVNFPSADAMAWFLCMLFGGIISATDPVAVVALLKELGASKKLGTLIEGESLLNDGTAIVAFVVLLAVIVGETTFSFSGAAIGFLKIGGAGAVVGVLIGLITAAWVKRVFNDPEIEIAIILVGAYLTFYAAETFFGVSGVLGLVALGVVMASFGRTRISPEVEHFLHEFIEFAAFICNVLIFIIVGVVIAQNVALDNWLSDLIMLGIIYVIIHLVRAVNMIIYYLRMKNAGYGLPGKDSIVVWWGALRGAIGLALALVVASPTLHSGLDNPIPETIREQFLFFVSGIVLLTLLVNATTIKSVVAMLGLTKIPAVKALMMGQAAQAVERGAQNEMDLLKNDRFLSGASWGSVRGYLPDSKDVPTVSEEEKANIDTLAEARRRLLEKEKASYWNQFGDGLLSPQAVNALSGNVSEVLDLNGSKPLTERSYLDSVCGSPSFIGIPLDALKNVPVLGGYFSDRLSASYDAAKGFVVAQDEVKKLVGSLSLSIDDGVESEEIKETLIREIDTNRLVGLGYIKDMQEKYPDVTVSIETKQAIRSLLNHERATVKKMKKQGAIEADEATRMLDGVEERIKDIMDKPLKLKLPTSQEVLREVTWLQGMPSSVIEKIIAVAQEKTYQSGEKLMSQGDPGDGLIVITRGSVLVSIGDRVVDIMGRGSVIGEMAVLAGIPRTANVSADTGVTAVWLSSTDMQSVMAESKDLTESLWRTAGARFAENILGDQEPYRDWSQLQLRRWIAEGRVESFDESVRMDLYGKVAILISGRATIGEGQVVNAPAKLDAAAAQFDSGSKIYLCSSI
jgi:NhaP-type Na+/H+ or K+/H+ antiporter